MKENMTNKFLHFCEEGNVEGIRECLAYIDVDCADKNGNTALHITSLKGYTECIRVMIAAGANIDLKNLAGDTPLHVALSVGRVHIAVLLIQSGADVDLQNAFGDSPIHIAAKEGFTSVVHTLCAFGCSTDFPNDQGLYPVHLAARNGHVDIIRYLCIFGTNVEQRNLDGIKAEIMAFKNGHYAAGELLNKLRIRSYRESYINQLIPTNKLLARCNIKFLGCAGTGKTTLIRSLKAGYFLSLFSRSKSQNVNLFYGKSSKDSLTNTQIEMDITSRQISPNEFPQYEYTQGIEIHQASFSSGEVNLWDFSGLDTYHSVYDYFLGDSLSFYVIVFDLSASPTKQHFQCSYWLSFLHSRLQSPEALHKTEVRVQLIGTHADVSRTHKDVQGSYMSPSVQDMRNHLADEFPGFAFEPKVILCDAHLSSSQGIREIKNVISEKKIVILQNVIKSTQFLDATVQCLKNWRKEFEVFPVISWEAFASKVHRQINPLAGSEHITELITQLSIMAEIFYVRSKSTYDDLIVLDMNWLCSEVVGVLLSLETIARARMTGCYTEEDFQTCFPHGPADKMLGMLSALQICTQCENDGEIEFEFPCYNLVERLDGLWTATDERYTPANSCYAGVRLRAPHKLLQTIFTRLQVHLRRAAILCQDPDSDLYQWFQGSKLCLGDIESFITLEEDGQVIEIKVRGPISLRVNCFYFLDEILNITYQVLLFVAPGLLCEKHVLSSEELRVHADNPHCWPPEHLLLALLSPAGINSVLRNPNTNQDESITQLIGFGCENLLDFITLAGDLPFGVLSGCCLQALAQLLDPPDPYGKDWCLLAVKLGLSHKIASLDNGYISSKTLALLELWGKSKDATIGRFIKKLIGFGREDAARVVMLHAPFYRITKLPDIEEAQTPIGRT